MRNLLKIVLITIFVVITGCAAPQKKESFTLFYPPPPELPRLQWLAAFTGEADIVTEKSAFDKFITGEKGQRQRLDKPYGAAMYDGKIYVCDLNRTVMVFDFKNRTFGPLEGAKGPGRMAQPLNISVDKEGNKYVADPVRGQIIVFDRNDLYLKAFGTPGGWKPVDAVVFEDRLYVADLKNAVVVVFDMKTGEIVKRIGRTGNPAENLFMPTNITFDKDGTLYISDAGKFQILKYDRDGHYIGSIGKLGTTMGTFARPKGIAADRENRIYAVDAAFDNVQIFNSGGDVLLWFGQFGKTGLDPGDFFLPAKVSIDYDNVKYFEHYADPNFQVEYIVLVTSQFGDNMVNVYGYGKEKGKRYPSEEELKKLALERLRKAVNQQPVIRKENKKEQD